MKIVGRTDWKTLPFPGNFSTLALDQTYTEEESNLIREGFLPREMEDKWFIFFEKDTLYIHRSWTGVCVYQVHFVREGKSLHATHAEANRNPEEYNNTSYTEDVERIYFVIQNFLLTRYE